jgi:hypothetical protein
MPMVSMTMEKRRLTQDGPDHDALQQHTDRPMAMMAAITASPERKAQHRHAGQATESTQHHQIALGEAHGLSGLVDQHEPERDQAVDASDARCR